MKAYMSFAVFLHFSSRTKNMFFIWRLKTKRSKSNGSSFFLVSSCHTFHCHKSKLQSIFFRHFHNYPTTTTFSISLEFLFVSRRSIEPDCSDSPPTHTALRLWRSLVALDGCKAMSATIELSSGPQVTLLTA